MQKKKKEFYPHLSCLDLQSSAPTLPENKGISLPIGPRFLLATPRPTMGTHNCTGWGWGRGSKFSAKVLACEASNLSEPRRKFVASCVTTWTRPRSQDWSSVGLWIQVQVRTPLKIHCVRSARSWVLLSLNFLFLQNGHTAATAIGQLRELNMMGKGQTPSPLLRGIRERTSLLWALAYSSVT